jgi:SAM-dependent methyltransferase
VTADPLGDERLTWEDPGCLLCGSAPAAGRVVARFPRASYRRCRECGLVYLSPRLTEDCMLELYRRGDYFLGEAGFGYATYEEDERAYRRTFARRLDEISAHQAGGRLLDVGCGTGWLIDAALARGFDAHGVEASEYAVGRRPDLAGRVRRGSFEDFAWDGRPFDVITLMDVFEHLYHPGRAAARLAELTAPGGVVAIATPDYDAWLRRVLGRRSVSFKVPEHITYYTRGTLGRAVGDHLQVIHVEPIGQYCTPGFLASRLDAVVPLAGRAVRGLAAVRGPEWLPYVPSGSLLALLRRKEGPAPVG